MKKITLFIVLIAQCILAQNTNIENAVTGLDSPRFLATQGDIVYVSTARQILAVDITDAMPTTTPVFTLPTPTATNENGIFNFVIDGTDMYVLTEEIDAVNDVFLFSEIVKVDLNDISASTESILISNSNFISSVSIIGDELFYVSEVETPTEVESTLKKIDLTQSNASPIDVIDGFGFIEDIVASGNLIYMSSPDNTTVYVVDTSALAPVLTTVADSSNGLAFIKGLFVDDENLYISRGNEITRSSLSSTLPHSPNAIIANETYQDTNNGSSFNANFRDVVVGSDGYAYMTLRNQGLIVKAELPINSPCEDAGSMLTSLVSNITRPNQVVVTGNDLYVLGLLGIEAYDISTNQLVDVIHGPDTFEFIFDFEVDGNIFYVTSVTFDDDFDNNPNFVKSEIKKVDMSTFSTTVILTDTNHWITSTVLDGNDLYFVSENPNDVNVNGSDLDKINVTTNTVTDLGITYDFFIGGMTTDGTDLYFSDGNSIYELPIASISSAPSFFLENINTDASLESMTIDSGNLYFANGNQIQRVLLTAANPESAVETMAINGTYNDMESDGGVFCSDFYGIAVTSTTLYATLQTQNLVVSATNQVVLSNENDFSLDNNAITLITKYDSVDVQGLGNFGVNASIYNLLGQKLETAELSSENSSFSTITLNRGIYILVLENDRGATLRSFKFLR